MVRTPAENPDYQELGILADEMLGECGDDVALLAEKINSLPAPVRYDLLSSDYLNAFQVFYFFFRSFPEEIEMERLILVPASELQYGIRINEIDLYELIFAIIDEEPVMIISDGERILARFSGTTGYRDTLEYLESAL